MICLGWSLVEKDCCLIGLYLREEKNEFEENELFNLFLVKGIPAKYLASTNVRFKRKPDVRLREFPDFAQSMRCVQNEQLEKLPKLAHDYITAAFHKSN